MDMKDVYAALEKLDNGADLITAIKGEINTLNNEAKKNRIAGEHTAEKLKNLLAGLDLEDADDVADKAKNLKAALDTFAQGGKKPTEVAKQITDLTAQVNKVTKQLDAMNKTAQNTESRISGLLEKNLFPPTDTFIASIAQKYGVPYTKGKKGEDRFYFDDDEPIYPLNDGFIGEPKKITLKAGSIVLDRYGGEKGTFVATYGTALEMRALPRGSKKNTEYHIYSY